MTQHRGILRAHYSKTMNAWLAQQASWLEVVRLPPYAPELNPIEGLWSAVKGKELANYAAVDLDDLWRVARRGFARVRRNTGLLWSLLAGAGLTLPSTG